MFQEFRTQNRIEACLFDNRFIFYLDSCLCFIFEDELFFPRHCMPVFLDTFAMQRLDFKNSAIAIKLNIMILNLYLTSERSQSKKRC